MVLDGTFYTTYEKTGALLGLVPQKLKVQVTSTRFQLIMQFSRVQVDTEDQDYGLQIVVN